MEQFIERWLFDPAIGKIVTVLVGILIIIVLVRSIKSYVGRRIKDNNLRYRTRKFISLLGYLLGIVFFAAIYSDRFGGLTVALGVAGAGIAFALQEVIASFAGWFVLNFGHYYKTGDRVQLGGIRGDVIDIGLLRTTLMECGEWVKGDLYSGRVVRIANSFVFKEPVFNYSGDFPFLWDEISLPIRYGSDHRRARQILQQAADEAVGSYAAAVEGAWKQLVQKYLLEEASLKPMITLIATDNWLEFTVRYVVEFKKRRRTKDQLFTRILDEIDKTEGGVALASTTVALVEVPKLDVHLSRTD